MKSLVIDKPETGYQASVRDFSVGPAQSGSSLINVQYSTLNYKDALAITGKGKIIRDFPLVAGIDLAGTVDTSPSGVFSSDDQVILNGFGYGESRHGGLAQQAVVQDKHLILRPVELSASHCMMLGTAGYTAMLCVLALQDAGVTPDKGEILVTGGNGGVGSTSIMLLSALGFNVVTSTGRPEEADFLTGLGASSIIHRDELNQAGKPLGKERWAGVIDSLGSHTLANACATTQYGGAVAACGLAQGMDLPASVAPFILRGVKLLGIDSVYRPLEDRKAAWTALAELIDSKKLESLSTVITLDQAIETAHSLLEGKVRGRVVVDLTSA